MEDKFGDLDDLIYNDVLHENRTEVIQNKEMFIDNVRNTTSLVGINIYALIYEQRSLNISQYPFFLQNGYFS
ncbi:hypothetical protein BN2127_JRS10_03247 [Bacillus subtilis]|nr:hypothetical protein BN2127_JRS10_03247 [Bacillus subtilis]